MSSASLLLPPQIFERVSSPQKKRGKPRWGIRSDFASLRPCAASNSSNPYCSCSEALAEYWEERQRREALQRSCQQQEEESEKDEEEEGEEGEDEGEEGEEEESRDFESDTSLTHLEASPPPSRLPQTYKP